MDSDCSSDDLQIASAVYLLLVDDHDLELQKKQRKKRRWWVRTLFKNRNLYDGNHLLRDLSAECSGHFENFCRMSSTDFYYLLSLIESKIARQDTILRRSISAKERLALTLRFLATGDSYQSLSYLFKISKPAISQIVPEVCEALNVALEQQVQIPQTADEWKKIATGFEQQWNFPRCIGAIDGKHCVIQNPFHSGSEFINYHSTFSIVLMILCDADYCITYANIGAQGRISDGGVFRETSLSTKMERNTLNLPSPEPLPNRKIPVPYVIVGDNAFPLKENLMVPYSGTHGQGSPERIFHYRLSRARRVVENVFGIMSAVFRILRKPILLQPEKVKTVVRTCVLLHNFLRRSRVSRHIYTPRGSFDSDENGNFTAGSWRTESTNLTSLLPIVQRPRTSSINAKNIRKEFAEYFCSNGKVPWQDEYA